LYFSGKTINEHCHLGKANVWARVSLKSRDPGYL
jgi:hypothetical protein